ncbi:hypothetical protein HEMA109418_10365 [Helcobacillus massiliensis]
MRPGCSSPTTVHYGSAYGGNALLGKISHALHQASYDGWRSGRFLAEQFMLLGIVDTHTGRTYHVCGGFPSASGKTNLAMTLSPDALGDRYRVEFYGDDIAWLWVGNDGRLYGMNPENGVFGVAKDTNETTNPAAIDAIRPGSGTIFTNVAHNARTGEVWWEGKTPRPPADTEGWRDWTGRFIFDRTAEEQDDLDRLLSIDTTRWHQEMTHRDEHLAQFPGLPHAIRDIHARITASLDRR